MAEPESDLLNAIAETCQAIREKADITRMAFAREYELDESMISMFERGRRQPKNVEEVVSSYASLGNRAEAGVWKEIAERLIKKRDERAAQAAQRSARHPGRSQRERQERERKRRPG